MKYSYLLAALFFFTSLCGQEPAYDHVFFDNSLMSGGYFYSRGEYKSPSYIQTVKGKLPVSDKEYFTAKNSLCLNYVSQSAGSWSAVIIYNDWRGKDFIKDGLSLDFRLLITSNTTFDELPLVAIATDEGASVSDYLALKNYISTQSSGNWYRVRIPLADFNNIAYKNTKDIRQVIFKQGANDGKEHTLYVDQVELQPTTVAKITAPEKPQISAKAYERHVDISWNKNDFNNVKYIKIYRAEKDNQFKAVGIQDPMIGRFTDYTSETDRTYNYKITALDYDYNEIGESDVANATTYRMNDTQLLDMVQEASFRYYWDGAEPMSGLALENIPGRRLMIASGASGFGLMALIVGAEKGFITREQATERFKKIVTFLSKTETYHGAYAHFIDGTNGKTVPFFGQKDNGADLVETSFLFQGLLAARQYFDKNNSDELFIRNTITKLWQNIEWDWFKQTKDSKYLYWHWSPDQEWVINHKLIGWNETMITYLLAMASPTHAVSKDLYYSGWASQEEIAQKYRSSWGQTTDGSKYYNGNVYQGVKLDVGVSSGGPLFFIHYSYMGFDPHGIKDKYVTKDYFENFRNIARISYNYCIENPKKQRGYASDAWGLTASDGPWGYRAAEAALHQDDGTIAPTGALASFPYLPEQSMDALKNYYRNYGSFLWGEYGFRDAFNLNENWCANIYMGLNQAPVTVMIENHRTGLIWNLFMKDPDIKKMVNSVFLK